MAHLGQEDQDRQNAIHRMVKMISDGENRKKLLEDTAAKVKDIAERHKRPCRTPAWYRDFTT